MQTVLVLPQVNLLKFRKRITSSQLPKRAREVNWRTWESSFISKSSTSGRANFGFLWRFQAV